MSFMDWFRRPPVVTPPPPVVLPTPDPTPTVIPPVAELDLLARAMYASAKAYLQARGQL
mgnify:FL=1